MPRVPLHYEQEAYRTRSLEKLHPYLVGVFRVMQQRLAQDLAERGLKIRLSATWRSEIYQEQLYRIGRTKVAGRYIKTGRTVTNAKPGQSYHNGHDGLAWAFDIFFIDHHGNAVWEWEPYALAWHAVKDDPYLSWGGLWRFPDGPHFQFSPKHAILSTGYLAPAIRAAENKEDDAPA